MSQIVTHDLTAELIRSRAITDELFRMVPEAAVFDRPIAERHRIIFYIGHLEAFDRNLLRGGPESELDRLFAFGIDPRVGHGPADTPADWPSLAGTRDYVREARDHTDRLATDAAPQLLNVAIEHRLMHAETFAYMLHAQPYSRKAACRQEEPDGVMPPPETMIDIPAGTAALGCRDGFGWDNEFLPHDEAVQGFQIRKHKVTNAEYLRFVDAGADPPPFWTKQGRQWMFRGMFAEIPLPPAWPVYVTHREASAFAEWTGRRLPTEAQFHRAAFGSAAEPEAGANADFRRWDPCAVNAGPENGFGVSQSASNGWEWTATPFGPFTGFQAFSFYPGYSAAFFDGEHYVLKGGSPRTARRLIRPSFRNWFRKDYAYVYATFRTVEA